MNSVLALFHMNDCIVPNIMNLWDRVSDAIMAATEGATANGPVSKMYRLEPYYGTSDAIELPACMYKLENIQAQKEKQSLTEMSDSCDNLSVIEKLEKRQEKVLSEIQKLQRQVQELMRERNISMSQKIADVTFKAPSTPCCFSAPPPSSAAAASVKVVKSSPKTFVPVTSSKSNVIEDLVINASPSKVPLSLFVLQQLLSKQYSVLPSSFVHSTAKSSTPSCLKDLYKTSSSIPFSRNDCQIGFSVVWKEDKYFPVLKVNPSQQTPIIGECNIARYLSRLLTPAYDSGDALTSTQIDALIDLADCQLSNNTAQKANFMKAISGQLGKSQWMMGENFTLADIVIWSAVHQSKQASGKAPDNIKRWLESCSQLPEFALAKQLI